MFRVIDRRRANCQLSSMKKLLLGTAMSLGMMAAASAADLGPAPAPIYTKAPLPAWSWTGFYLGLQGGAGWGTTEDSLTASQDCVAGVCGAITPVTAFPGLFRSSYGLNGLHGGGTAGFNWQAGPGVFGVEGDISAANIDGTGDCTSVFSGSVNGVGGTTVASCHTKLTGFGTLTGRLGATIDHALVYIKAGGAWAHFNHAVMNGDNDTALLLLSSVGDNRSGFTVG